MATKCTSSSDLLYMYSPISSIHIARHAMVILGNGIRWYTTQTKLKEFSFFFILGTVFCRFTVIKNQHNFFFKNSVKFFEECIFIFFTDHGHCKRIQIVYDIVDIMENSKSFKFTCMQ